MIRRLAALAAALLALAAGARADPYLADFPYPYPVAALRLSLAERGRVDGLHGRRAKKPNGRTVVLLHGKNFCGATWESVIKPLSAAGYRVIVPDQIGFCRSAKPAGYQMSLHQLAANTHALLASLGVEKPIILGHSMGGMLGMRYALQYPDDTSALVLVNPIGLEDWTAKGVPPATIDALYAKELKTDAASIKKYQLASYYHGDWRPAYDRWVDMLAGMYRGKDGDRVAWAQARSTDMIQSQPVIHEIDRHQGADAVADRRARPHGGGPRPRQAGGRGQARQLSRCWRARRRPASRTRGWSPSPIWATRRTSRRPSGSTRRSSMDWQCSTQGAGKDQEVR